jgi:hypothetical protein
MIARRRAITGATLPRLGQLVSRESARWIRYAPRPNPTETNSSPLQDAPRASTDRDQ